MTTFWLSLLLGLLAGLADYLGGFILVLRSPSARALRYFVALGSGFMLGAALLEMVPEGMAINHRYGALLILAGYCAVHFLEHTLVPHFHFGEETHGPGPDAHGHSHEPSHAHGHTHAHISAKTSYSVLFGLATHTFFDGVAIGSGFALSSWLGWILFFAVFLHKIPEGFTVASVMMAGGRGRRAALNSALFLGATTVAGVLVISLLPSLVREGLPLSAGVTLYVAATDLVPEVNREPGIRMALIFFLGVLVFFLLRQLAPS
jgi:zinc transporter ZupT